MNGRVFRRTNRYIAGAVWCLLLTGFPGLLLAAQDDAKRGAAAYRACIACHTVEPGRHLTGPSLADLFGRKAGAAPGFMRYSDALQKSGIIWNERTLNAWLANPAQLVPDNDMAFPGIKELQARQDLIAFPKAVDAGKGVPTPRAAGPRMPRLKSAPADDVVKAIRYCGDTYSVTTESGKTHKIWEFNLRLKTDSTEFGPHPGRPVLVGVGMSGDRVAIVFSGPGEFANLIKSDGAQAHPCMIGIVKVLLLGFGRIHESLGKPSHPEDGPRGLSFLLLYGSRQDLAHG